MAVTLTAPHIHRTQLVRHETKRKVLIKFSLVAALCIGYFGIIAYRYGIERGVLVTILSWSFFVLCTPIADAGFLVDFPLRLITRVKMVFAEMVVWAMAIGVNIYAAIVRPDIYATTGLLTFFKRIIDQPIPFWSIIILSMIGTFVSIRFGDELLDVATHAQRPLYHRQKRAYRFLIMVFLVAAVIILYRALLQQLGINIPGL